MRSIINFFITLVPFIGFWFWFKTGNESVGQALVYWFWIVGTVVFLGSLCEPKKGSTWYYRVSRYTNIQIFWNFTEAVIVAALFVIKGHPFLAAFGIFSTACLVGTILSVQDKEKESA